MAARLGLGTRRRIVGALAGLFLAASPVATAQEDEAAVREVFDLYKTAVLELDGGGALRAVSASTVDHYALALDLALDADSGTVAELPFMDRLLVLTLRHRLDPKYLRRLTGSTLFVYGVKNGWVDRASMRRQWIGDVDVEGDLAVGALTDDAVPGGVTWLRFVRERDGWRVDLTSIFDIASHRFEQSEREEGLNLDRRLASILQRASGRPLHDTIWTPVGR